MKNLLLEIAKITTRDEINAVVDAVKAQQAIVRSLVAAEKKAILSVGMNVIMDGNKGVKKGIITKMKIKRVIVRVKNAQGEAVLWDCPLSMLEVA